MSKISEQPGRAIGLNTLVDRERGIVQIIRTLKNTKGCMCDSGNMGQMSMADFREFCERGLQQTSDRQPTLMELYGHTPGHGAGRVTEG